MSFLKAYSLKKTVIDPGIGCKCPFLGTVCQVHLSCTTDGISVQELEELSNCKVDENTEIELGLGKGEISFIIDRICKTMKAQSTLLCSITFYKTSLLLPNQTISFSLRLISWSERSKPLYMLEPEICLEYALKNKETGTALFKQSRIFVASCFYSRAIKYLIVANHSSSLPNEMKNTVTNAMAICYVNLAACLLKHKLYSEVIACCDDTLNLQPNNLKALYRRATSYLALNDLENAEKDILAGLQLDSRNRTFSTLKIELKNKNALIDAQLSKRLKTLFV